MASNRHLPSDGIIEPSSGPAIEHDFRVMTRFISAIGGLSERIGPRIHFDREGWAERRGDTLYRRER